LGSEDRDINVAAGRPVGKPKPPVSTEKLSDRLLLILKRGTGPKKPIPAAADLPLLAPEILIVFSCFSVQFSQKKHGFLRLDFEQKFYQKSPLNNSKTTRLKE
jgi:hypothetical protein